jgi:5-methylcytosine-specific restriction endonuclease McrA
MHYKAGLRAAGSVKPQVWTDRRRDNYHRRKALKKGTSVGDPVRRELIARRDRWCCQLCGERVDERLVWPHPLSASLDHVVPLTKGGAHEPANVQLAHLRCNVAKSNRGGGEQLALIG